MTVALGFQLQNLSQFMINFAFIVSSFVICLIVFKLRQAQYYSWGADGLDVSSCSRVL